MNVLKQYKKAVVGALGVVVSAILVSLLGDGVISPDEFVNVVVLAAGTISLAIAPNVPGAKYTKSLLAAVAAAATVVLTVHTGGITVEEWAQIGVAVATAAGVYKVRNQQGPKVLN